MKGEDRERVEISSKQKQKFTHTTGSKSFACVAEAKELSSGQKVRRLQLFDITHRKKDGSPMTSEAGEIMEKLNDKKAEYEAIALNDSSLAAIHAFETKVQRLKDQMAQMQASTVGQIAQLKVEAALIKAEVQRKYEELQLQLKKEAAAREAEQNKKYNELQL
ncbi:Transcriptional repressor TUP1 [Gossypium arboreum]|uniref:Transcriptional repressor TUP1 n=1 Tax=Gossypium arboreum TaxID=29729 RepID=A0A0B0PKJ0_GOSAR|nr:Transcriptional repressor TUP1 [Gossypium arboreum]